MDRAICLRQVQEGKQWDMIVVGGGATGLGIAVDAASRGYKVLLLEKYDFAKSTSSRSTKLVHGGVRYLANGDIKLVFSALYERGLIFKNAPHLAREQSFLIPCYTTISKIKFLVGLKLYDWMAGRQRIGRSVFLNKSKTLEKLPTIKSKSLKGSIRYYDGQFDDARMAVNLAQTAVEHGGSVINYAAVTGLLEKNGQIIGVKFTDTETGHVYEASAKVVINATGVFVDDILKMASVNHKALVRPSQGTHVVVDKKFLGGEDALMIPETSDGRVLFGVPWHGHVLLGTTDTPLDQHLAEPRPLPEEVTFILDTAAQYMTSPPKREDILSVYAGMRPLAAKGDKDNGSTKEISRDHKLIVDKKGLITITGGKWTTYRKMAEETVDKAIKLVNLDPVVCRTKNLRVHGYERADDNSTSHWKCYGKDREAINKLAAGTPELAGLLHPNHSYIKAEVVWAIENEMARTIEDVLSRRIRLLMLNAKDSLECAPWVAKILKEKLNRSNDWEQKQLAEYAELAKNYFYN
ncbi:FAD-dependent oxidoreductase [Haoranjiania flava]|uniref:Glycerol-3-phosphate dehydrogenase/oxidase n=1 Tax=Haoranjiania flava TaxID=1856322 RepID=A0AAE3LLY6_9BACT|nr:glycerol-3-phosphate dehydrogenase/oxidase [Haoranjiania flava]MCU7693221.1 glycerol-3-phosphate dehydrogenase/oxidase [Haoranjiania flava]